ncbi:MAG: hypothetical protein ACOVPB_09970, partial [Bacteroidia bacterium]
FIFVLFNKNRMFGYGLLKFFVIITSTLVIYFKRLPHQKMDYKQTITDTFRGRQIDISRNNFCWMRNYYHWAQRSVF